MFKRGNIQYTDVFIRCNYCILYVSHYLKEFENAIVCFLGMHYNTHGKNCQKKREKKGREGDVAIDRRLFDRNPAD